MVKFFIITYIVLIPLLLVITPFDYEISSFLYGDINSFGKVLSQTTYLPIFFIGYIGMLYYYQRIHKHLPHLLLKIGFIIVVLAGIILLSQMFINSMRFLPYHLYLSPIIIAIMLVIGWFISRLILENKLIEFDYLFGMQLSLIVLLYYVVTRLKRIFGRARFYMVQENDALFSPWYELRGMVFERDFYSIPSGHISFAALTLWLIIVAFTVPQLRKHLKITSIVVFLWIALQSYLRILLGEHFLSDTVFSVILSMAFLHVAYFIFVIGCRYVYKFLKIKTT